MPKKAWNTLKEQQTLKMTKTGKEDSAKNTIVQFWTPSLVTQRRGERVQDHLSAHARAKPI